MELPYVAGNGRREVAESGNTVLGRCHYSAQIHHSRGTAVHYTLVALMVHETCENRMGISLAAIFKNYLGVDVSPLHAHECHLSYRTRHSLPHTVVKYSHPTRFSRVTPLPTTPATSWLCHFVLPFASYFHRTSCCVTFCGRGTSGRRRAWAPPLRGKVR